MAQFEFLGRLTDQLDSPIELSVPPEIKTIARLRLWLNTSLDCDLFSDPTIRAIVNDNMASDTTIINNEDKIVFYPPVGGG